jgi:hypothetical protein
MQAESWISTRGRGTLLGGSRARAAHHETSCGAAPVFPMRPLRHSNRLSVSFPDVRVLQDEGTRLLCIIAGNEVWVPVAAMRRGNEVWAVGDRGTLIVARWFAERANLLAS